MNMEYLTPDDFKAHVHAGMTERVFRQRIIDEAARLGWRYYFTQRSDRSPAGFPDLVLVRGDRLIFAELKTMTGRVRPEQTNWINDLAKVKEVSSHLWRPDRWETIRDEVLS